MSAAPAEAYSRATARATVQAVPTLLAAARVRPFTRLLDIAAGPGYAAGAAAALGLEAVGVDVSDDMIAIARLRQPGADFVLGDAASLPFADESFDVAVCNFGHLHFAEPARAIAEARRVLRPGGRHAFSQWLGPDRSPFFAEVLAASDAAFALDGAPPYDRAAFSLGEPEAAQAALSAAGFDDLASVEVPIVYHAPGGDFLDLLRSVAVKLPSRIDALSDAARETLRASLNERLARFVVQDPKSGAEELRAPMPAFVHAGSAPV